MLRVRADAFENTGELRLPHSRQIELIRISLVVFLGSDSEDKIEAMLTPVNSQPKPSSFDQYN